MKRTHIALFSLLVSALIWTLATWPLIRHVAEGVPVAHTGAEQAPLRYMEAGDHLQFLYYYWLLSDMLKGGTPWMYNLYEFHTGDEEARRAIEPYYVPFSLVYTFFSFWTGRALAWNMTGFVAIWLTYLFTWLLVRRFVSREWLAAAMSVIAIMLPYRWFSLLGGSPTGIAMTITPMLMWALDRAVRDRSVAGGVWAGAAIIMSFTADLHVFFFNMLFTPIWCVFALIAHPRFEWRVLSSYVRTAVALIPTFVAMVAVVLYSRIVAGQLGETDMAEGRSLHEARLFSPNRDGFFSWVEHPIASQVYVGYALVLLLLLGAAALAWRWFTQRPRPWRDICFYGALLLAFAVIAVLSLGPHAPRGAKLYLWAREWIPHYDMMRQTGKIFSILPPILALTAALAVTHLTYRARRRSVVAWACGIPLLLIVTDYALRTHPPVCILTEEQPAYAAVADDAAARGVKPHAFIVTLWPGDSHFASIYQYYCSLYRIRMINGYNPAVGRIYFDEIFLRFQSINQGWLTDEQADELLSRGIDYVIVHENLFPEKVSPFPILFTLYSLLGHERLDFIKQYGPVWAFRILEEPRTDITLPSYVDSFFPARHWLFQRQPTEKGVVHPDATAARGQYLALGEPGASTRAATVQTPPADNRRWMVRARGQGTLRAESLADDVVAYTELIEVNDAAWHWLEIPAPGETYGYATLDLYLEGGQVDLCSTLFTAGRSIAPVANETETIPAALFFHAGHLEIETGAVRFHPKYDWAGAVFYGPKLPLGRGSFEVRVTHETTAEPGTLVGHIEIEQLFTAYEIPRMPVTAGEPTVIAFTLEENLPINVIFHYEGTTEIRLVDVSFTAHP